MSEEKPTTSNIPDADDKSDGPVETVTQMLSDRLSLLSAESDDSTTDKVFEDLTFAGLINHWKKEGFKNIVTMVGAGISTSAGIPDFRSPGSGLYDNLQEYNLPHPSAIFEVDYFLDNPKPFFALAKELYPGTFDPTLSHYFVRLLHEKGLLLRHYTQNIDTLERVAGIPDDKLVEAHGTFFTNHCFSCQKEYSMEWVKEHIFADRIPICGKCGSIVKPDIVFFGENLPHKFYMLPSKDFDSCDLLIIMGTSLEVQPFASLVDRAGPRCVRLLINRTRVGHEPGIFTWFESEPSLLYNSSKNIRDVAYIGDCDEGVMTLVEALGWADELKELMEKEMQLLRKNTEIDKERKTSPSRKYEESTAAANSCTNAKDSTKKSTASTDKDEHSSQNE